MEERALSFLGSRCVASLILPSCVSSPVALCFTATHLTSSDHFFLSIVSILYFSPRSTSLCRSLHNNWNGISHGWKISLVNCIIDYGFNYIEIVIDFCFVFMLWLLKPPKLHSHHNTSAHSLVNNSNTEALCSSSSWLCRKYVTHHARFHTRVLYDNLGIRIACNCRNEIWQWVRRHSDGHSEHCN